jgi:tetratricopeptide (TPR) repeat protein
MLGNWADATTPLEQLLDAPPPELEIEQKDYEAHAMLLAAYNRLDRVQDSGRLLDQILKKFPERPHAWILAGKFYLNRGHPLDAVKALERAKTLPPEADRGIAWPKYTLEADLSQALVWAGRFQEAQATYPAMGMESDSDQAPLSKQELRQAERLMNEGKLERARQLLEPAANQKDAAVQRLLAGSYAAARLWGRATRSLVNAIALDAGAQPGDWGQLAVFSLNPGMTPPNLRYAEIALARESGSHLASALCRLGSVALHQRRPDEALTFLVRAVLAVPQDAEVLGQLDGLAQAAGSTRAEALKRQGLLWLRDGDFALAASALASSIQFEDSDPQTRKLLAAALNAMGKEEEAIEQWRAAGQPPPSSA